MQGLDQYLTEASWRTVLGGEFSKPYFADLEAELDRREKAGATIFPAPEQIFAAFNLTPFDAVKVVILGQDPYHGEGQAMGLSFSVPEPIKVPPSLRNMLKEIDADTGGTSLTCGDLTGWARQGVLLLNTCLTVEQKTPGAHTKLGWETFTDQAISRLAARQNPVVFMLWGSHAQKKKTLVSEKRHEVLMAPHPSPLSAYRGFFGCKHFSLANAALSSWGMGAIDW